MTEALASRVAGLKLGGIVAVLLLPMIVLSFFMVGSLRDDMQFARRELLGVEMSRLVMPVAMGAASGKLDDADVLALRKLGAPLAAELDVKKQFNTALATLITYSGDQRFAVESLVDLQREIGTESNIILDPWAESYFLGSLFSQSTPDLLSDFVETWSIASRSLRDKLLSHEESSQLLLGVGVWQEAQWRVTENLQSAVRASLNPDAYKESLAIIAEMQEHPEQVGRILAKSQADAMPGALAAVDEFGSKSGHILDDIHSLWSFSAQGFESLIRARLSAMQVRLYTFLGIAAAACLVGVGGAALMFRSTLQRLDGVEQSRDVADAARRDAEKSAEEVKRINEEVIRLNSGLARNIEMLRDAQDDSVRKGRMAQLGQLTATVAHELRNPLGAVRTSVFLLERKIKGKGLGVEPQLDRINNGVTRCDNIISQLLDFARVKPIQTELVGLDDWLAKLIEEEAQSQPAAVAIECNLGLGDQTVPFDPSRIRRAVINMLNNASEAMVGKGDAALRPAQRSPLISIATKLTDRGVELSVTDNGPGILPENLGKIFEPLFTTKNFGTGLGIPAVQKIMEQHGGGLEAASQPGQGACFTAWWPLTTADQKVA